MVLSYKYWNLILYILLRGDCLVLTSPWSRLHYSGSVRGSPNGTNGNFTNGTIGSQWYHWLTNGTNCTIGRANGTIGITIGTNGITNGTIGKTLNDIGIPLIPLGNPEHTQYWISDMYPEDEDE